MSVFFSRALWRKLKIRIVNVANIPALVATIVIICAANYFVAVNKDRHRDEDRSNLRFETNLIASKIQGLILNNVELVRGLAGVIATEPAMSQDRFADLARRLFHEGSQLRTVAGAPEFVVSLIYPKKENETVLGLDYRKNAEQRATALRARDFGETTLGGPFDLVQGGRGLIARYPVYYTHPVYGMQFWGLASAVIDIDKIYRESGLLDNAKNDFLLLGKDGEGAQGEKIYGLDYVKEHEPIRSTVDFGLGKWELMAIPKGGWPTHTSEVMLIWAIAFFALLIVVIPFLFVGWLYRERLSYFKENMDSQRKMARLAKRLEMALQTSRIGIWEYDPVTHSPSWDDRMNELYGFPLGYQCTNEEWRKRLHPDDRERVMGEVKTAIECKGTYKTKFRICLPDGTLKTLHAVGSILIDETGDHRLIGVNWDISEDELRERELFEARAESERRNRELEAANARIEASAKHDFLTGLPNRRYLNDKFNSLIDDNRKLTQQACIIKIDLDGFKEINDTFGHAAGDAMLVNTANLLRDIAKEEEFAVRVGGDEFVILCLGGDNPARPEELSQTIIREIQKPVEYKGRFLRLGASIGVARCRDAGGNPDKLLSNADLALYQSKQNGKGRCSVFNTPMFELARKKRQLADDLLRGIDNKEFVAFYQGQYCAHSHDLAGCEALARWQHPERGLIAPVEFVALAESLGVMGAIDAMILDHALESLDHWESKKIKVPRISVNVSAKRLGDRELIPNLKQMSFDPSRLTFELVESTFLDRSDAQVAANIRQIRQMGVDIEIDDFGTAYASIVSLTHLLPNRLKIDRQLIRPVINSADQRELVHSIIHIGRTLGIGTVAEGVESMEHADILRIMGVDLLQGFAFCKPMSREDFAEHHLKSRKHVAA